MFPRALARRDVSRSWLPVSLLAGAILLYLVVAPAGGSAVPRDSVARASDFEFEDINPRSDSHGRKLALRHLYAERGVVLRFIASWCQTCREELPDLEDLHAQRGAPIVMVAADEYGGPESLLIVAERNELTAPILFVPAARAPEMERKYGYEVLPATYVIDRQGTIQEFHQGALTKSRLMHKIENALGL